MAKLLIIRRQSLHSSPRALPVPEMALPWPLNASAALAGVGALCSCEFIAKNALPNPSSRARPLRTWPLRRGRRARTFSRITRSPALHACPARCCKAGSASGRAYLDSRLGEVDLQGQLLPGVDVGVVRLREDPLQLFQLRTSESGADAPLLALLVEAAVIREELVRNWRTTEGTAYEQNGLERASRRAGMWGLQRSGGAGAAAADTGAGEWPRGAGEKNPSKLVIHGNRGADFGLWWGPSGHKRLWVG